MSNRRAGWYFQGSRPSKDRPNDRTIYLNELTSKIWITGSLNVFGTTPNWPLVTTQIYQCDATSLFISKQLLYFNDLLFMASKCEILHLSGVVIMKNDGVVPETEDNYFQAAVSLEAIFKALPNVKIFKYILPENSLNIITTKTAEELLKIPHFLSLGKFEMSEIPGCFDINSFFGHIKENKKTKVDLHFSNGISDEYKTMLQTIVDEILQTENRDYKVPWIKFSGITNSSYRKMRDLYYQK